MERDRDREIKREFSIWLNNSFTADGQIMVMLFKMCLKQQIGIVSVKALISFIEKSEIK